MMKKLLLPVLIMCAFSANAQLHNSWIDYSKTYYKFKVGADKITRIPQSVLSTMPGLATANADQFQLWKNGQQVRIYTSVSGAPFGASDYIEFWGEMNTGKTDAELYAQPQHQLADRYSLETDTTVYFLTVNPAGGNLRYINGTNPSAGSMTAEAYFMRKYDVYYKSLINRGYGRDLSEYVYSSAYDNGEGYTTNELAGTYTENLSGLNVYTGGPVTTGSFRFRSFANTDNNSRTVDVKLFSNSLSAPVTSSNTSETIINQNSFPLAWFQNPSTAAVNVTFTNANPAITDRNVIATMGFTYPATFNFNGEKSFYFELPATATGNYLLIDNFNYGSTPPVLYELNGGGRYTGDVTTVPGKIKFVLPASADPLRRFVLNNVEAANINSISSLTSKTFINYNTAANRGDYIIISNPVLYNDGTGTNYVDQYRQYRSSAAGGSYTAKVYDIAELTDQFGFGIKKHPSSIRDFVRYMDQNFSPKPKYILLVGRGMTYYDFRPQENNPAAENLDLVPTFGWPSSDILMVSEPGTQTPITPVGRIAAINGAEVGSYLQKVKDYELAQKTSSPFIADKAWMKDGIHIVGGANDAESTQFTMYMDDYKMHSFEDTLFGGHIETFKKTTSSSVQQASSERISQLFQSGIGFIGYFGHSSANVFEFNLSSPENYNNPGKYPFFNVSGCSAGNMYTFDAARLTGGLTLSDKYILLPQRGSIGFLADTHFGIPFALNNYNKRFYENFGTRMYGQGVGDQIKEVTNFLGGTSPSVDYYTRIHLEEINLHGDPAIKINNFAKPDHVIEDQTVSITPAIISVADPSFHVKVDMRNMGRAMKDSMKVYIKRVLPDATIKTLLDTTVKAVFYRDSLEIDVAINPLTDVGQNQLMVEVDYTNKINELYETNNKIGKQFYIFEDNLRPVYPPEFAIVNNQNITYTASTANPLVSVRPYVMEVDTTELFNSAFKKSYNITSPGGAISFTPTDINFIDGTVYYWRTAAVPSTGNYVWNNSSFIYLTAGGPGYNMSHYYQLKKNSYDKIQLDPDRKYRFKQRLAEYTVRSGIYPYITNNDQIAIVNDGYVEQNGLAGPFGNNYNAIRFYIIDSLTIRPLFNQPDPANPGFGQYGSYNPVAVNGSQKPGYFQFDISTAAARNKVRNFLTNNVASGNMVIVTSSGANNTHFAPEWATDPAPSMYTALMSLGFGNISQLTSDVPYIFAARKGSGTAVVQRIGTLVSENLSEVFNISGAQLGGTISSPVFGPASRWTALHWNGTALEAAANDKTAMEVYGINTTGVETLLATVNPFRDTSLTWVNATTYPNMRLRMLNSDSLTATPHQLTYWRINADFVPEGAVAPNIAFTMKDTVEIGQPIDFTLAFKNISGTAFSNMMKIAMKIRTATNYDSIINIPPGRILASGDTLMLRYTIPSQNYPGMNTLSVDFNPNNDQPEQTHFNNVLFKNFFVKSDQFNPLLDVTFDGVHILSRDIVASKPAILVKLKDESRFMYLTDTALVKLQLRYPDQTLRNFYFNTDTLRFTPATATAGENAALIDFRPYLPEDGEYELIVSGKDASGNSAGNLNYHTVFTVINKPMISEMLNYPNPFTTSTAFVFTLTGSRVPQNIRIQILTITGKVVREITTSELGPIHVGRNITEYKWDGTDMYGQKLGNGVYLYRVLTNLEGKSLDKYKADGDNTDKYFKKGYGKMYLMR